MMFTTADFSLTLLESSSASIANRKSVDVFFTLHFVRGAQRVV